MTNKKRQTFQCWNCGKTYTLIPRILEDQCWIVACPYCHQEATVQLNQYQKPHVDTIYKDNATAESFQIETYQFPDVIPTQKRG